MKEAAEEEARSPPNVVGDNGALCYFQIDRRPDQGLGYLQKLLGQIN